MARVDYNNYNAHIWAVLSHPGQPPYIQLRFWQFSTKQIAIHWQTNSNRNVRLHFRLPFYKKILFFYWNEQVMSGNTK